MKIVGKNDVKVNATDKVNNFNINKTIVISLPENLRFSDDSNISYFIQPI